MGKANQGIGIAQHTLGHAGDDLLRRHRIDTFAKLHIVHDRVDQCSGLLVGRANCFDLFL